MLHRYLLILCFCGLGAFTVKAQADQNFKVAPSVTSCDSLPRKYASMEEAYRKIAGANFRLEESMKTTRITGYRNVFYRSCDRDHGFLMIQIDEEWVIYDKVPVSIWEQYKQSRDLEGYFRENIKGRYRRVTDPI